MDEPELPPEVVETPELETMEEVVNQILPIIEQQVPVITFGGEGSDRHDVTICLVPIGMGAKGSGDYEAEILTVLKVNSSRLCRCSKYFQISMTERWGKLNSNFLLETQTDLDCYIDCFSRMYSPFMKHFKNMEYSVKLLKVAAQIQFTDLIESTLLHISCMFWTDSDEHTMRLCMASPDFPHDRAQDLLVRLGTDASKEACREKLCAVVQQLIRSALGHEGSFLVNRALFNDLLSASDGVDSDYAMQDVIRIVNKEARDMLLRLAEECDGQIYPVVPEFADKLLDLSWILETLLRAKVAEEVANCLVHLSVLPNILALDKSLSQLDEDDLYEDKCGEVRLVPPDRYTEKRKVRNAALELAKLVLLMYEEVAVGNLLLRTPERVALLRNWYLLLELFLIKDCYDHATKAVFSTLPFTSQMELLNLREDGNYLDFISTTALAKQMKKEWPGLLQK